MTYDDWKLMDGSEHLGPAEEECDECGLLHHGMDIWGQAGWHRCACGECIEGRREFDYDREHEGGE